MRIVRRKSQSKDKEGNEKKHGCAAGHDQKGFQVMGRKRHYTPKEQEKNRDAYTRVKPRAYTVFVVHSVDGAGPCV
jgi:hypothetical protein